MNKLLSEIEHVIPTKAGKVLYMYALYNYIVRIMLLPYYLHRFNRFYFPPIDNLLLTFLRAVVSFASKKEAIHTYMYAHNYT